MSPKEELIQAIERLRSMCKAHSPDELIWALLELLRVMQRQPASEAELSVQQRTVLERMGGEPKHMLSVGGLSDRDNRRSLIATHFLYKGDSVG